MNTLNEAQDVIKSVMVMALQRFLGTFWICFYLQADAQATA